jgi:glycosidase
MLSPSLPRLLLLLGLFAGAGAPAAGEIDVAPVAKADPGSTLAEGWQHGAFMEIFVRGYKDSDGDGIGDLRGLTQSLDYLHDLGVRGLWLMPVTRSQDHDHGYAVSDYRDIEPAYGTLADFDELLRQAHARGIGVIVDYVLNHSAAEHPLFVESSRSRGGPYRSWYVWRERAPSGWQIYGKDPWNTVASGAYLSQFSPTMPDFNLLEPKALAWHQDNLRFWLNRGVDGFRFDAVTHLVENGPQAWQDQPADYALMAEIRAVVAGYQRRYMVCEAPVNSLRYGAPSVCGSAFAMEHSADLVDAARGRAKSIQALAGYFTRAPLAMATMISNHDLFAGERLWNQVRGDRAQYRLAAASYLLQPGTPFIYYGEEIGMAAASGLQGDRKLRTPMSWTAASPAAGFSTAVPFRELSANVLTHNVAGEQAAADSLLAWYKSLLALRNRYPSLAAGSYEAPSVRGKTLMYRRRLGGETSLVLINYAQRPATVDVGALAGAHRFRQVFPRSSHATLTADARGSAPLTLAAQSVRVFVSGPLPAAAP